MIGVNTFGLINKMQDDMPGTMRAIANAGFDEVELLLLLKKKQWKIPIALAAKETIPLLIGDIGNTIKRPIGVDMVRIIMDVIL